MHFNMFSVYFISLKWRKELWNAAPTDTNTCNVIKIF